MISHGTWNVFKCISSVNKALAVLEPVFSTERDWKSARQAFTNLQKLLELVKGMGENRSLEAGDDFFYMVDRLKGAARSLFTSAEDSENLTKMLDLIVAILHNGAQMVRRILFRHKDEIQL